LCASVGLIKNALLLLMHGANMKIRNRIRIQSLKTMATELSLVLDISELEKHRTSACLSGVCCMFHLITLYLT